MWNLYFIRSPLGDEITTSLALLWTHYAGIAPTGRTEIHGDVVTCTFVDAVENFNRNMISPQSEDAARDVGYLTSGAYKPVQVDRGRALRLRGIQLDLASKIPSRRR